MPGADGKFVRDNTDPVSTLPLPAPPRPASFAQTITTKCSSHCSSLRRNSSRPTYGYIRLSPQ